MHRCIHAVVHLIEDHAERLGIPPASAPPSSSRATRPWPTELELDQNERELLEHMHRADGDGAAAWTATPRWRTCGIRSSRRSCADAVVKCHESREHMRSVAMDKVLTGKYTAHARVLRRHAADLLADVQRHRAAALATCWRWGIDYVTAVRGQRADRLRHQPGGTQPDHRRYFRRCGQRAVVPAHHRHAVFLPVHSGGHRLYGPGGLRDGQAAAQDRPVRAQHRAAC